MNDQMHDERGSRPPKGRSPSYPGVTLASAIERARVLKERAGRHPVPMATITGFWGYKTPASGPASVTYSALKKFGLLEDEGSGNDRVGRLTDLAWDIVMNPNPLPSIQKAALRPPIHREMWDQYGNDLPPEDALRFELVGKRGFTESGFVEFLREYRATIAYAKLTSTDSVEEEDSFAQEDEDEQQNGYQPPPKHRSDPGVPGVLTIPVPVIGGSAITIAGAFPITEAAWSQFLAVLAAMKPGLVADSKSEDAS
jgi:hypothetical protein